VKGMWKGHRRNSKEKILGKRYGVLRPDDRILV